MFSESKKEILIISSAHKKLFYWFVFFVSQLSCCYILLDILQVYR